MAKNRYEPVEDPAEVPIEDTAEVEVERALPPKRTIRVLRHYQGRRTNEQVIRPGSYYDDDPELHGLADFLLEIGLAVLG